MFWSRNLVSDETADWICETFSWLISNLGPERFFGETRLVLPTREFFTAPGGTDHATAEAVFDEVKRHMGMAGWPCRLIRQEEDWDPNLGYGLVIEGAPAGPAGAFWTDSDVIEISYNPGMMGAPLAFISVLAHELSHYLLAKYVAAIPGGVELHELATDITAIYAGFGVLQLESGWVAEGYQGGWSVGHLGYLSSESRAFALALFLTAKGIGINAADPYLSSDKAWLLRKAAKMLKRQPDRVAALEKLAVSI
jgi:hypothetical protein